MLLHPSFYRTSPHNVARIDHSSTDLLGFMSCLSHLDLVNKLHRLTVPNPPTPVTASTFVFHRDLLTICSQEVQITMSTVDLVLR